MQPQEGQVGLIILYEVQDANGDPRDISSFTTTDLIFKKPDGTTVTKAATFQTDGSDGLLTWETVAGDLSPYGSFQVQAHLAKVGVDEYTEVAIFHANANIIQP